MTFLKFTLVSLVAVFLGACGGSPSDGADGNNPANKPQPKNRVNWSTVSSDFNPHIDEIDFRTDGFSKINIDAFGFNDDVEVVYSHEITAGEGYVRIYKVWKEQASWGDLRPRPNGDTLDLKSYGTYQCSIRITNGQIVELKGGCYVRLQVFLPVSAEIEVYNVGKLITKRFFPMSNSDFLKQLDDATWASDKFAVIENYLWSYEGTNKKPSLTAYELGMVIGEFSWKKEKLKALSRLHSIVSDRENLENMIDENFSPFERGEARRIVGL